MKKIITFIITISIIFSSLNNTFATNISIEELLNINNIEEENKLNFQEIKYINFQNQKYNNLYIRLKQIDKILKKWFIKNYNNWIYDYYQINWLINSYNNFIYYTNELLFFIKLKEENNNFWEIDIAIHKSIINMKSNYLKVKNLAK